MRSPPHPVADLCDLFTPHWNLRKWIAHGVRLRESETLRKGYRVGRGVANSATGKFNLVVNSSRFRICLEFAQTEMSVPLFSGADIPVGLSGGVILNLL